MQGGRCVSFGGNLSLEEGEKERKRDDPPSDGKLGFKK